ncbi:High mobility group B protein 14 [Glycine soja]
MAKKAKGSHSASSASASSSSDKLVLRIKSNEGTKRSVRQTNSRKKLKAKQKKNKQKFDAMKPRKPPTAFFYFLYSYFCSPFFFIYASYITAAEPCVVAIFNNQLLLSYMESLIFKIVMFTGSSFSFLREDFRKEFQEQNPDVKSMRDIGKACGEKWKTMTYEEKVQYYDIATKKREEFDSAMAEFNKKMENGEFDETDDESEFDE